MHTAPFIINDHTAGKWKIMSSVLIINVDVYGHSNKKNMLIVNIKGVNVVYVMIFDMS